VYVVPVGHLAAEHGRYAFVLGHGRPPDRVGDVPLQPGTGGLFAAAVADHPPPVAGVVLLDLPARVLGDPVTGPDVADFYVYDTDPLEES
jgi:hypothetical protein